MIMVMITEVSPNSAPQMTQLDSHRSCGCDSRATATGAASVSCLNGTNPVSTLDIRMYSTVHIARLPSMPIGMPRCGSLASWATVDTPSKPMYAKKMMAEACNMPLQPNSPKVPVFFGMYGTQF